MSRTVTVFRMVLVVPVMLGLLGCSQPPATALRSTNEQERCDAFYVLFKNGSPGMKIPTELLGQTTAQIHKLLGDPTQVAELHREGVHWLQVTYLFNACPAGESEEFKKAWLQGWRFGPSLIFRNGRLVPVGQMSDELGLGRYPIPPKELSLQPGGRFP